MINNKQTVGKIATDLQKQSHGPIDTREIAQATEKEYLDNLVWAVKHAKKQLDCSSIDGHDKCADRPAMEGTFYIAALVKKEKLLENVLRNYFIPTIACPTPHFDQTVYKYNHEKEEIEYLWTIPDKDLCEEFMQNKQYVHPEEYQLMQFISDYYNGNLFKLAKKLNGENQFAGATLEGKELWQ